MFKIAEGSNEAGCGNEAAGCVMVEVFSTMQSVNPPRPSSLFSPPPSHSLSHTKKHFKCNLQAQLPSTCRQLI